MRNVVILSWMFWGLLMSTAESSICKLEGVAKQLVLSSWNGMVLSSVYVSGEGSHILAYDANKKEVAWRQPVTGFEPEVSVDNSGKCYLINGPNLLLIDVMSGKILKIVDLKTLEWPNVSDKRKAYEKHMLPNSPAPGTWYYDLTATSAGVFLRREYGFGSPYMFSREMNRCNWVFLDKDEIRLSFREDLKFCLGNWMMNSCCWDSSGKRILQF